MKYGHFDDENSEYVITTPQTPYPWINYMGADHLLGMISNTGGGYCYYKDARYRRLLRYRYNSIPLDMNGRYFYIREEDGAVWSPTWKPVMTELDQYECRHGMGYSIISGVRNQLSASVTFFIPEEDPCEIHLLELHNRSAAPRTLTLFSYVEFALWDALTDMTNFQRNLSVAETEVEDSVIYHKTEYRERRNHFAFYSCGSPMNGFDTDRDAFVGPNQTLSTPQAVTEGLSRNSQRIGWFPIASHSVKITLQAGEKKAIPFILGYVENAPEKKWAAPTVINKEKARHVIAKYDVDGCTAALNALKESKQTQINTFKVTSDDKKFDRMVNIWNPYQTMTTFTVSRSASGFESGIGRGIGFRDSNQDVMGAVSLIPDRCRARILELAEIQFKDGSAYHQFQPLTKQGNADVGSHFNDDPLWLLFSTVDYLRETGDDSILDAPAKFVDGDATDHATLLDHMIASVEFILNNLGPHGLPLIGRADWNDCLNLNAHSSNPDESFQTCDNGEARVAESIFIAGMFCATVPEFIALCTRYKRSIDIPRYQQATETMKQTVIQHGRDAAWYLRAYDAEGHKVGSSENKEGSIYIEPQGMCVMAGLGIEDGFAEKALDSVHSKLATDHGIMLQQPAYTSYRIELGEISSYPPGYKENAGVFSHNNAWIVIAETLLHRPERAFDYYKSVTPAYREAISELHRMEPYVYAQTIAGADAPVPGEAKNSWLTGTSSWFYIAATRYILGIRPEFDGLTIDPCLPGQLGDTLRVTRVLRGVTYHITIRRGTGYSLSSSTIGVKIINKTVMAPQEAADVMVECTV
ncbi:MAG: glycosyl transferase [Spartobacteria bacterium]|nr:glycosyl transferase [Spartobacteria bacterium]